MGIDADLSLKCAVFLDRDGVLNRNVWNPATHTYEAPLTPDQFELLPKVIPALQLLQVKGYLLFLVSNQPNHAKGKARMGTLNAIHGKLESILKEASISFAAFYYCFHHPAFGDECVCRKPSPHFLYRARDNFGVRLEHSWMVGDRVTDIECGRAAGTRTLQIQQDGTSETDADATAVDLWSATKFIANNLDS